MSNDTTTQIEWRIIPGYDGRYEVSNTGLVRRAKANRQYAAHTFLSVRTGQYGYSVVKLTESGRACDRYLHRLIMLAFRGECPKGQEVNHIDGNKTNNHLSNLEYVSHAHNIRHALDTLKAPFGQNGEAHNLAKLDDGKIREIRKLAGIGFTRKRIAELYGVTGALVSGILNGRYWSHVKD